MASNIWHNRSLITFACTTYIHRIVLYISTQVLDLNAHVCVVDPCTWGPKKTHKFFPSTSNQQDQNTKVSKSHKKDAEQFVSSPNGLNRGWSVCVGSAEKYCSHVLHSTWLDRLQPRTMLNAWRSGLQCRGVPVSYAATQQNQPFSETQKFDKIPLSGPFVKPWCHELSSYFTTSVSWRSITIWPEDSLCTWSVYSNCAIVKYSSDVHVHRIFCIILSPWSFSSSYKPCNPLMFSTTKNLQWL